MMNRVVMVKHLFAEMTRGIKNRPVACEALIAFYSGQTDKSKTRMEWVRAGQAIIENCKNRENLPGSCERCKMRKLHLQILPKKSG
jgi:hypothetical protein